MGGAVKEQLKQFRKTVIGKLAILERCRFEMNEVDAKINEIQKSRLIYNEATQILKDLYEQTQERFHGQIMQMVSYCLKEVFGEDAYEFKIDFAQKRNQVEASFVFVRDGESFDPLNAAGGGVLAVACFALRLAVIYLTKQQTRSIMVLDEPFSQLSVEYRDRMAELLDKLSTEFDFQFILITHEKEFEIGTVHQLGPKQ